MAQRLRHCPQGKVRADVGVDAAIVSTIAGTRRRRNSAEKKLRGLHYHDAHVAIAEFASASHGQQCARLESPSAPLSGGRSVEPCWPPAQMALSDRETSTDPRG